MGATAVAPQFEIEPPDQQKFEIEPPKPQGSGWSRFLSRATGGMSDDIAAHPGAYNPFGKEYWQRAKDNANEPLPKGKLPFEDTAADLKSKNYAGVAGDILPGAVQLGLAVGGGKGAGRWADAPPVHYHEAPALSAAEPQIVHYPDPNVPRELKMPAPATRPNPPRILQQPAVMPAAEPSSSLYSRGPGQVPADVVGETNPNILAGNQGVIVRQPKLLKAAPTFRQRTPDMADDMAVSQEMANRATQEDISDLRAGRRDWNEANSVDVPKWKRLAEFRAQLAAEQVMREAELAQTIPARSTKTSAPRPSKAPRVAVPGETEDLLPKLQESLAMARAKRGSALDRVAPRSKVNAEDAAGEIPVEREGTTLQGSSGAGAQAKTGAKTSIPVPGEDRVYPATYQVRELGDVQASHRSDFQANEKYALTNDRNYSDPVNQEKIISNSAPGRFDPAYHLTDNPDATNGPIVIDSDGNALGGNGRAMILDRVYRHNPAGAQAYKDMLLKKAGQFGLDPEAISGMKQPVLVRQIDDAEFSGDSEKQDAVTDFNKKGTAELTPAERAIADSRRLSQSTLDDIAGRLEAEGPEAGLADALRGRSGVDVLDRLIKDGVITSQERAALSSEAGLTEAGKTRIQKLLVGRFYRDPAQIDSTAPAVRTKLEKIAAPLARIDGIEGWDLTPSVREAIDILEEARTHNITDLDDLVQQRGLFGENKYSAEALAIAKDLQSTPANALAKNIRRYVQDASDAQRPMLIGEPVSPEQAFKDAFR